MVEIVDPSVVTTETMADVVTGTDELPEPSEPPDPLPAVVAVPEPEPEPEPEPSVPVAVAPPCGFDS